MTENEQKSLHDTFNIVSNVENNAEEIMHNTGKIMTMGIAASIALAFISPMLTFLTMTGTGAYNTIKKRNDLVKLSKEFKEVVNEQLKKNSSFAYLKDIEKELEDVEPLSMKDLDLEKLWQEDKIHTGLMIAGSVILPAFMPLAIASLMGYSDNKKVARLAAISEENRNKMLKTYPGQFENKNKSPLPPGNF